MTNELKPCPFCGGEAHLEQYPDAPEYFAIVRCSKCDIKAVKDKDEEAIAAWNTRAERTCHNTEYLDGCFACSACGEELENPRQEPNFVKWCPFCGAKVVD